MIKLCAPNMPNKEFAASILRIILCIVSAVLCTIGAFGYGLGHSGLSHVRMVQPRLIDYGTFPSAEDLELLSFIVIGLAIAPSRKKDSIWFLSFRPLLTIWIVLFWALCSWFISQLQFLDSSTQCAYPSCWPTPVQELLAGSPLLLVCTLIFILDVIRWPSHVFVRIAVPLVVFVGSTIIQYFIWDTHVLPILSGPPHFLM